ncbi:hypothetical protein KUH32_08465 [Thalassococcus sp. CAU 1522]|uniref:DUF6473 domain-containing protein n=1 Tax=Thalassococcus arenae TaxID=2851652 RepID=A0ABS6N8D2_9RHOB|nr:DUF6473 family protein [Thalassococcus arenae]MBV2359805.1 hypothetical protein [Thalassococcus arenae]
MTFAAAGRMALEYYPCRYGASRTDFRGPRRPLEGTFVACIGGTETYGRFMPEPYPVLLERATGRPCVNFGGINAGLDLYLKDPAILGVLAGARVVVMQVMGAQNMSNRFYAVHPRRNDRFLRASERLQELFPEVDFTEFHFTRHMLVRLHDLCPARFGTLVEELRLSWVARMKHLLAMLPGSVVLVWLADHLPGSGDGVEAGDPLFVTPEMLETVRPRVSDLVTIVPAAESRQANRSDLVFTEFEAAAAAEMLGSAAHAQATEALADVIRPLLTMPKT